MSLGTLLRRRWRRMAAALATFAVNFALDRGTKALATAFLAGHERISLLNNTILLLYVRNEGAFLSLGAGWPPAIKYALLLILPLAVCAYGLAYCMVKETDTRRIILVVTVIAGGAGNLIDRLLDHFYVIDFLNFGIGRLRTGILNVADLSITFGAIALVLYEAIGSKRRSHAGEAD